MSDFDTPTNVMHSDRLQELTERIRRGSREVPLVAQEGLIITDADVHVIEMEAEWEPDLPPLAELAPPRAVVGNRPSGGLMALMLAMALAPAAIVVCVHELAPLVGWWLAHR